MPRLQGKVPRSPHPRHHLTTPQGTNPPPDSQFLFLLFFATAVSKGLSRKEPCPLRHSKHSKSLVIANGKTLSLTTMTDRANRNTSIHPCTPSHDPSSPGHRI